MALGYDMTELTNSVNAAAEAIHAIAKRKEEQRRYEEEQKRLEEQARLEEEWRVKNYEAQQEAFNYQKELNEKQMEREDTQFSRAMEDYKRAGLSGLAAIGSSAGSGSMTSLPSPQMDTSGSRDVLNSRINSNRNYTQSRLERYKAVMNSYLQTKQLQLERTNQVLQGLKLGNDIATEKINRAKLQAETNSITHRDEWENVHGYRNLNWQASLINLVDNYLKTHRNGITIGSSGSEAYDSIFSPYEKKFLQNIGKDDNPDITKMNESQLATIMKAITNLPGDEQKNYKNVKKAVSNEFYRRVNGFYR